MALGNLRCIFYLAAKKQWSVNTAQLEQGEIENNFYLDFERLIWNFALLWKLCYLLYQDTIFNDINYSFLDFKSLKVDLRSLWKIKKMLNFTFSRSQLGSFEAFLWQACKILLCVVQSNSSSNNGKKKCTKG